MRRPAWQCHISGASTSSLEFVVTAWHVFFFYVWMIWEQLVLSNVVEPSKFDNGHTHGGTASEHGTCDHQTFRRGMCRRGVLVLCLRDNAASPSAPSRLISAVVNIAELIAPCQRWWRPETFVCVLALKILTRQAKVYH